MRTRHDCQRMYARTAAHEVFDAYWKTMVDQLDKCLTLKFDPMTATGVKLVNFVRRYRKEL